MYAEVLPSPNDVCPREGSMVGQWVGLDSHFGPSGGNRRQVLLATLPPTARQRRAALAGAAVLLFGLAVLLPFAARLTPRITGFIPALDAAIFVADTATAGLLLANFSVTQSRALWALGCGYLFSAALVVAHGVTFPGAISPTVDIGGSVHINFRIYLLWHLGLPISLLAYVWLRDRDCPKATAPTRAEIATICAAAGLFALAGCTVFLAILPPVEPAAGRWITAITMAICAAALAVLWRYRRTALDQWLMVVMVAMIGELAITALIGGRGPRLSTVGFYAGRLFSLATSSFVLIGLLLETRSLYAGVAGANMLASILHSSQALSAEIELPNLIRRLMSIALKDTGADRVLLIGAGDGHTIEAEARLAGHEVALRFEGVVSNSFLQSVIRRAAETRTSVVVDDTAGPHGFVASGSTGDGAPRSALCLPLMRQGRLSGLLYLENSHQPYAFTPERARMLELLASQAAISLESTRLYAELQTRERELREALTQLTEGQNISKTGTFTSDIQAGQQRWSDELYRVYEIERATPPTIDAVRALVHPDDLATFNSEIARRVEGHGSDFVFRIITQKGQLKHLHAVVRFVQQIEGRPVFMGAIQDVTESRLAEAALSASEANLRRANSYLTEAQRLSKTGSFTWDPKHNEIDWSDELFRILDFRAGEKADLDALAKVVHPDDIGTVQSTLGQAAQDGREYEIYFRIQTRDGEIRHLHTVGQRRLEITDRHVFVGATQDITASKLAEEALARTRAELAHVARVATLNAMTASIAHEVNQPLSGILTNANTCVRMLGADPPNLAGAIQTAKRTIRDANRAGEVVRRLRDMFSTKPPTTEPLDIGEVAAEVIALSTAELRRSGASLRAEFAEDLPRVGADRVQLQQVILNLLLNAADAMASVDDRPRVIVVRTGLETDGAVRMDVEDSGAGLEPGADEKVFNAFYTTKAKGMGVGLSISRSIIESHNGRLWAANNLGPGATFSVRLPAVQTA
jgi:PAS domain S-box-containing protein